MNQLGIKRDKVMKELQELSQLLNFGAEEDKPTYLKRYAEAQANMTELENQISNHYK